jgi:hypothetical protein
VPVLYSFPKFSPKSQASLKSNFMDTRKYNVKQTPVKSACPLLFVIVFIHFLADLEVNLFCTKLFHKEQI